MNARPLPPVEEIRRLLKFEPNTGRLIWKVWHGGTARAGSVAGSIMPQGHIRVALCGQLYMAHRIIWKLVTGREPVEEIDHINGARSDNRWANLREASRIQNAHNTGRPITNRSGFKGVHWHAGARRWRATIKVYGQSGPRHLGYFDRPEDAHAAYRVAAVALRGEFARVK